MALAPALANDELRIGRVQRQVHAAVGGVGVADLGGAVAGHVERLLGKQPDPVLLQARRGAAQRARVRRRQPLQVRAEPRVRRACLPLVHLPVRRQPPHFRARPAPFRHSAQVSAPREIGGDGRRLVRVANGEDGQHFEFQVARDGLGSAARAKSYEVFPVIVDEL